MKDLKKIRKKHKITQVQAAELMGIGVRQYQYLEAGKCKDCVIHARAIRDFYVNKLPPKN